MSELLGGWKRTNYCANFTKADAGKEVILMGWANVRRDLGALVFVQLRDRTGLMQIVFNSNTLSEAERYFQYVIDLDPNKMEVGENFITDIRTAKGVPLANGTTGEVNWYQFKVPVAQPSRVVGNISDFKSIRFLRMFMKDFEKPVTADRC